MCAYFPSTGIALWSANFRMQSSNFRMQRGRTYISLSCFTQCQSHCQLLVRLEEEEDDSWWLKNKSLNFSVEKNTRSRDDRMSEHFNLRHIVWEAICPTGVCRTSVKQLLPLRASLGLFQFFLVVEFKSCHLLYAFKTDASPLLVFYFVCQNEGR